MNGYATRDDTLVICRGSRPSLIGGVGWLADHTVRETETVSPAFVKWRPFSGRACNGDSHGAAERLSALDAPVDP